MPRSRTRATLDAGKRLTLASIPLQPNSRLEITWRMGANLIAGSLRLGHSEGEIRLRYDEQEQLVALEAAPRHLGGMQWYFLCPRTGLRASVLWMPPGASFFASRHAWRAVYLSKSLGPIDRAWRAKRRIARRLGSQDPNDYGLPDRPARMWRSTYDRLVTRYNAAEQRLDESLAKAASALLGRYGGLSV